MHLDKRQKDLLKEIVENYIKTVKPVGSTSLCEKFNCSSATIRNEMASLEKMGLLEKTHLSSGRIPSEKGYKYYVDNLMVPKELTGEDILKLQTIFQNNSLEVNDAISKCVEIISEITNYTSVVLGKSSKDNLLRQIDIIEIDDNHIVALVCTNKGIVENKQFKIPNNISINEIIKTSEIINKMLKGTPIDEVNMRLEYEIKPEIAKIIKQYETVYNIFYDAFNDFTKNNVVFGGKSNILKQPEYSNNIEEVRRLIDKLDDEKLVTKIEENKEKGINIYIGNETEFDSNVTIIKTHYHLNGEEGTIAVVGPKRMEYDKVVGILDYIKKQFEGDK